MSSLHIEGIHTPGLRFAFTNITTGEFHSSWDGNPIIIQPGQTIEISDLTPIPGAGMGHTLADLMTDQLIDQIIMGQAKLDEVAKNQPYYRSPEGMNLGVPAARKVWEDQIIRPLEPDEESTEIRAIRSQLKTQLEQDMSRKEGVSYTDETPKSIEEFAQIKSKNSEPKEKKVKKAVRTKTIK